MVETENINTEFIPDVEITIKSVKAKLNAKNPNNIDQLRFETNKGDITLKPKITQEDYDGNLGITIQKTVAMTLDKIPEKFKDIAKKIKDSKECKVKGSYVLMTTEKDGEEKEYRYTSLNQLEKWEII